jgi:hypothetical protein
MTCMICGCSDERACPDVAGPCYWAAPRICSRCFGFLRGLMRLLTAARVAHIH